MPNKKLAAVLLTAGMAGGGVAGLVLGAPALSLAQSTTSTTTPDTGADAGPGAGPHGGHRVGKVGADLDTAATALGITPEELRAALDDGKSIADVAREKGVDVQRVIDALVAERTKRLDEAKADLPDRVTEQVNRAGGPLGGPRGPGGLGHGLIHARIEAAAGALGMTEAELRDALRDGKTLAAIAGEKNVPVQTVVDALVKDATTRIDQAVTDGKLTAERAATLKEQLVERVTELVNDAHPRGPGRGGRGPGGHGPGDHDPGERRGGD